MILENIDFTEFFEEMILLFSREFNKEEVLQIMEYVEILADANFRCYKANMIVIAERKKNFPSNKLIADMEWVARSVGEYRVSSKARINKYISDIKPKQSLTVTDNWMDDDVVYSIGEMMDRLSIEFIKRKDFTENNRSKHMFRSSMDLSTRVRRYLVQKLSAIQRVGYECVHEQRTYDLEGILEELVI